MKNSSIGTGLLLAMEAELQESLNRTNTSSSNGKKEEKPRLMLLLLLLILLLIPGFWGLYHLIRFCRRYKYRQLARRLKLSGALHPGDVDDLEMGRVIRGGDWLTDRSRSRTAETGNIVLPIDTLTPGMEFDPILEAAEKHKRRWMRRRNLTDTENSDSNINIDDNNKSNHTKNSISAASAEVENTFEEEALGTSVDDVSPEKVEEPIGVGMRIGRRNTIVAVAGTYDVTTTRVWLKKLVNEEENNTDNNRHSVEAEQSQGSSGDMAGVASPDGVESGDGKCGGRSGFSSPIHSRREEGRSFQKMLADVSPPDEISETFRAKVKLTPDGPVFASDLDTKEETVDEDSGEEEEKEVNENEEEEEEEYSDKE
ncbi:hypothetical protein LSM04_004045 [Trypanosoma melophagium]|uniref:uncharacterized protein n=1 Tax=Trypanosoma melophagium TaxID=715481 RepID=UPI00351A0AB8|nr:hypothetical protein LSM04_004045 [Trypanosoma melophagium]